MMKLKTHQFGEVEFNEDIIINFEDGILGFEEYTKYIVITEEDGIFYWLTCIDEPALVFPLFPLRLIREDFPQEDRFEAFGIVKLDKKPEDITLNMRAPIYLDQENKEGFQKIIDNESFPIDYKLFVEN